MAIRDLDAERRERQEQRRLNAAGTRFLTGGLTSEADTFLIGIGTVILMAFAYPLVGGWAFLAFPIVLIGAVLARSLIQRRR
jgi:hypothetical protein